MDVDVGEEAVLSTIEDGSEDDCDDNNEEYDEDDEMGEGYDVPLVLDTSVPPSGTDSSDRSRTSTGVGSTMRKRRASSSPEPSSCKRSKYSSHRSSTSTLTPQRFKLTRQSTRRHGPQRGSHSKSPRSLAMEIPEEEGAESGYFATNPLRDPM
jgi:hypothetical protein